MLEITIYCFERCSVADKLKLAGDIGQETGALDVELVSDTTTLHSRYNSVIGMPSCHAHIH